MVERALGVDTLFSAEDLDNKENAEFENILERDFQPLGFVEQIIVELDPGCRNNEDRLSTIAISAWEKILRCKMDRNKFIAARAESKLKFYEKMIKEVIGEQVSKVSEMKQTAPKMNKPERETVYEAEHGEVLKAFSVLKKMEGEINREIWMENYKKEDVRLLHVLKYYLYSDSTYRSGETIENVHKLDISSPLYKRLDEQLKQRLSAEGAKATLDEIYAYARRGHGKIEDAQDNNEPLIERAQSQIQADSVRGKGEIYKQIFGMFDFAAASHSWSLYDEFSLLVGKEMRSWLEMNRGYGDILNDFNASEESRRAVYHQAVLRAFEKIRLAELKKEFPNGSDGKSDPAYLDAEAHKLFSAFVALERDKKSEQDAVIDQLPVFKREKRNRLFQLKEDLGNAKGDVERTHLVYNSIIAFIDDDFLSERPVYEQYVVAMPFKEKLRKVIDLTLGPKSTDADGRPSYRNQNEIAIELGFGHKKKPYHSLNVLYRGALETLTKHMPEFTGIFADNVDDIRSELRISRFRPKGERITKVDNYQAVAGDIARIMPVLEALKAEIGAEDISPRQRQHLLQMVDYYMKGEETLRQFRERSRIDPRDYGDAKRILEDKLKMKLGIDTAEPFRMPDARFIKRYLRENAA